MMGDVVISMHDVVKSYRIDFKTDGKHTKRKDHVVLDGLNLEICKGEIVGVLGHNGSGKSTLLKLLAGVIAPDKGDIEVNGKVASILELNMGFHDDLTGIENLLLRSMMYGLTKKEAKENLEDMIKYADLGDYIYNPVRLYSSGMKSRLAFAVMMNVNADIFLIDEALSVGDSTFRMKVNGYLNKLIRDGKTILMSSHSPYSVRKICTRAILLDEGKITIDGNPEEVCAAYDSVLINTEENLRKFAEYEIPYAEYRLAKQCLKNGNQVEFEEWLSKAAFSGYSPAMCDYGDQLEESGKLEEASEFFRIASESEDERAMWRYAISRSEFNEGCIAETLRSIYEKGDHFDGYRYGDYLYRTARSQSDFKKAYDVFVSAASEGNCDAKYRVAMMHLNGVGVDIDVDKAIAMLEELFDQGHFGAMNRLADLYSDGRLVPVDKANVFRCNLALAKAGVKASQFKVAMMYQNGTGTDKDEEEARLWFSRYSVSSISKPIIAAADAAKIIETNASMNYYDLYMEMVRGLNQRAYSEVLRIMTDVKKVKNPELVFSLSEEASSVLGESRVFLADCYYRGIGVEADMDKAFELYRQAADSGNSRAMLMVALMYKDGVGVERDAGMYMKYLTMSSKRNNNMAKALYESLNKDVVKKLNKIAKPSRYDKGIGHKAHEKRDPE